MFDVFVFHPERGGVVRVSESDPKQLARMLAEGCFLQIGDFCRVGKREDGRYSVVLHDLEVVVTTPGLAVLALLGEESEQNDGDLQAA